MTTPSATTNVKGRKYSVWDVQAQRWRHLRAVDLVAQQVTVSTFEGADEVIPFSQVAGVQHQATILVAPGSPADQAVQALTRAAEEPTNHKRKRSANDDETPEGESEGSHPAKVSRPEEPYVPVCPACQYPATDENPLVALFQCIHLVHMACAYQRADALNEPTPIGNDFAKYMLFDCLECRTTSLNNETVPEDLKSRIERMNRRALDPNTNEVYIGDESSAYSSDESDYYHASSYAPYNVESSTYTQTSASYNPASPPYTPISPSYNPPSPSDTPASPSGSITPVPADSQGQEVSPSGNADFATVVDLLENAHTYVSSVLWDGAAYADTNSYDVEWDTLRGRQLPSGPSWAGVEVRVVKRSDGTVKVYANCQILRDDETNSWYIYILE